MSWSKLLRNSVEMQFASCKADRQKHAVLARSPSIGVTAGACTLMIQVHAGSGIFFFFLRILKTLASVSLGFAPFRYRAPSSRCSSTSRACMTGALHKSWGKRSSMLCSSLSASKANSGLPLLPVRFSTSTWARPSMQGVMQLVSSTCQQSKSLFTTDNKKVTAVSKLLSPDCTHHCLWLRYCNRHFTTTNPFHC